MDYIIKKEKNKHIDRDLRIKIEAYYNSGIKISQIAIKIGCCRATVYNEIKRGLYNHLDTELYYKQKYSAERAQIDYNKKSTAKGVPLKIGKDYELVTFVEDCIINKGWSPDAICGFIKTHDLSLTKISTRTLYNYIYSGLFLNVSKKNLRYKGRRRKKNKQSSIRATNYKGLSIEQRSKEINKRISYGHWEMDTVVSGKKGKGCLLVLTERKSRYEIIIKIKSKTVAAVAEALNELERKYKRHFSTIFKTITCDNGCEFLNSQMLESSLYGGLRTTIFYCHPYSAFERGSNENANSIIRRYIPKGADISKYTKVQIKNIENKINNIPRRILGYYSSIDFLRYIVQIA